LNKIFAFKSVALVDGSFTQRKGECVLLGNFYINKIIAVK